MKSNVSGGAIRLPTRRHSLKIKESKFLSCPTNDSKHNPVIRLFPICSLFVTRSVTRLVTRLLPVWTFVSSLLLPV